MSTVFFNYFGRLINKVKKNANKLGNVAEKFKEIVETYRSPLFKAR